MRKFSQLKQSDRDRMEILLNQGVLQKDIALVLKVDPSTISREIKRRKQKDGKYEAGAAQQKAYVKRKNSKYQGMKVESDPEMKNYIISKLKEKRSPDEIAGRMKLEKKSFYAGKDAIYRWLYSARGQKYAHLLCTKRYKRRRQKRRVKREMIPNRLSINQRPKGAMNKTRYKHFEIDTAVAPRRVNNHQAIAIASERKSKFILATKIKSLSSGHMTGVVNKFAKKANILTLTADNGIENRQHEKWNFPVYFADPYSPWHKPVVENCIGLLRRWFFKRGTDWSKVGKKELQEAIDTLNNKYRKSLGYKSALEVALEHDIIKKPPTGNCI